MEKLSLEANGDGLAQRRDEGIWKGRDEIRAEKAKHGEDKKWN